jgi:hypothetical protein
MATLALRPEAEADSGAYLDAFDDMALCAGRPCVWGEFR